MAADVQMVNYTFLGGKETQKLIITLAVGKYTTQYIDTFGANFLEKKVSLDDGRDCKLRLTDYTIGGPLQNKYKDNVAVVHASQAVPKIAYVLGIDVNNSDKKNPDGIDEITEYLKYLTNCQIILVGIDKSGVMPQNSGLLASDSPVFNQNHTVSRQKIEELAKKSGIKVENVFMVFPDKLESYEPLLSRLTDVAKEALPKMRQEPKTSNNSCSIM